jgi:hypothetical protein
MPNYQNNKKTIKIIQLTMFQEDIMRHQLLHQKLHMLTIKNNIRSVNNNQLITIK